MSNSVANTTAKIAAASNGPRQSSADLDATAASDVIPLEIAPLDVIPLDIAPLDMAMLDKVK
jgi:hypothetical protein